MKRIRTYLAICIAFISLTGAAKTVVQNTVSSKPSMGTLMLNGQKITAEIAVSPADRQQGLMFRQTMPAMHGMLFVFEQTAQHCFWMKNTPLPLTIGFFDDKGVLINTVDMAPFDESGHCPTKPARYALEMNQGWFAKHRIQLGSKLTGQPKLNSITQ